MKTHDAAQHAIACIKPEEVKKRERVEGWRRKVDFLQQCFGRSLGVSGRLTTLESRMQSYNKGRKEEREGGGSITCSSNHTLRQTERNIKWGRTTKFKGQEQWCSDMFVSITGRQKRPRTTEQTGNTSQRLQRNLGGGDKREGHLTLPLSLNRTFQQWQRWLAERSITSKLYPYYVNFFKHSTPKNMSNALRGECSGEQRPLVSQNTKST